MPTDNRWSKRPEDARDIALEILCQTESAKKSTNILLYKRFQRANLSDRDKRLVHELVYGVLRWRAKLDWIIEGFSEFPLSRLPLKIKNILRLALYQLLYTDKIPARAAVHEAVDQAARYGHRGTKSLVNAILRQYLRQSEKTAPPPIQDDPVGHLSIVHSHPKWLVERWVARYGIDRAREICEANNCIPQLSLRTNTLLTSREALQQTLEAEGIEAVSGSFAPECLRIDPHINISQASFFQAGLCQVQDEASMLISHLLEPQPGERILDACAGPGGKATHLAALMKDQGEIIAVENNQYRFHQIKENCQRLKLTSVKPFLLDVRSLPSDWKGFDRILVDAPCSGFGIIRHHPEIKWVKEGADLARYQEYQLTILQKVKDWLREDGLLVYCVCSFEPEETVMVIEAFLRDNPQFIIDPRDDGGWLPLDKEGYFWSLPYISYGMDGIFAVRLRKTRGA